MVSRSGPASPHRAGRSTARCGGRRRHAASPRQERVGYVDGRSALGGRSGDHHAALPLHVQRAGALHDAHHRSAECHDQRRPGQCDSESHRGSDRAGADARNGWHTVSLREAIRVPDSRWGRQDQHEGISDVWSNDISDVAIRARMQEDTAEAAAWEATKVARGWTNGLPPDASDIDKSDFAIGTRREQARDERVYEGSLTKRGGGTLFLAGDEHLARGEHGPRGQALGRHLDASSIDVPGGTLGGSGSVADSVDVSGGAVRPGLTPEDAAQITEVPVTTRPLTRRRRGRAHRQERSLRGHDILRQRRHECAGRG